MSLVQTVLPCMDMEPDREAPAVLHPDFPPPCIKAAPLLVLFMTVGIDLQKSSNLKVTERYRGLECEYIHFLSPNFYTSFPMFIQEQNIFFKKTQELNKAAVSTGTLLPGELCRFGS